MTGLTHLEFSALGEQAVPLESLPNLKVLKYSNAFPVWEDQPLLISQTAELTKLEMRNCLVIFC